MLIVSASSNSPPRWIFAARIREWPRDHFLHRLMTVDKSLMYRQSTCANAGIKS